VTNDSRATRKIKKQEPRKFFNVGAKNLTELERYLKLIILVQGGRRERIMEKREVDRSGKNNVEMRSIKLTYIYFIGVLPDLFYTHT